MKMKTRKSVMRKFKITKKGKVLRRVSFRRHLNTKKSANKKRQGRRMVSTHPTYAKKIMKATGSRVIGKKRTYSRVVASA